MRKGVVVYVRVMLPHGRHEHLFVSFYISLCVVLTTIACLVYVSPIELLSYGLLGNRSNLWVACVSPVSKMRVNLTISASYSSNADRLLPQ